MDDRYCLRDCTGYCTLRLGQLWQYFGSIFGEIRQLSVRNATRQAKKQRKFSRMVVETKELYTGIHYNLFFATGLSLMNAVLYGNILAIGMLIDVSMVFDFNCRQINEQEGNETNSSIDKPVMLDRLRCRIDLEDQYRNYREFFFDFTIYFILGQVAGASITNLLYYYIGPKKCMIVGNVLFLSGWIIMLDNNLITETLLCARFFNGLSSSIIAIMLLIYLYQIATPEYRGLLIGLHTVGSLFGMTMPLVCYYFISSRLFNYVLYQMFIGLLDVLAASVMLILPESPLYLLGQYNDPKELFNAEQSLQHLRSRKNPSATLIEVNRLVGEKDLSSSIKLYHPLFLKPLFCSMLLVMVQECCLFSPYFLYGQPLPFMFYYLMSNHSSIRGGHHFATIGDRPTTAMLDSWFVLTIGAFQITAAVIVVGILIRKFERRTILVITAIIVTMLNIIQGIVLEHYEQHAQSGAMIPHHQHYYYPNGSRPKDSSKSSSSINPVRTPLSVEFPFIAIDVCVVLSAICDISIRSVVWILIVEMPIHEYRIYNTLCSWIFSSMLTFGQLLFAYSLPHHGHILYYLSSILLIPIILTLFLVLPSTNNLTTNQIIPQFL